MPYPGRFDVIGRTYRNLNRYRQILRVLIKYGFGELLDTLKIEQYLEIGLKIVSKKRRQQVETLTTAERLRKVFEELGPTFVKLGQILSTRPDLIPHDYIVEFSKLQDHVPPFSYDNVTQIIKEELKQAPEDIFHHFEQTPIAAASIGQVHRATLKNGKAVVVKVQRPDIREEIEADIEIMMHLARLSERHLEDMQVIRPTKILEYFARRLDREMNYLIEASSIERFARQFDKKDPVYVPDVYHEFTTSRVLTMEYIDGIKATEFDELRRSGHDLNRIARHGADLILKQILIFGYFHADPHPGNVYILPDDIICYLDFGAMGRVNRSERENFVAMILNMTRRNERKVLESLLELCEYDEEPDHSELEKDLEDIIDQQEYKSVHQLHVGLLLQQLYEISTKHRLMIKPHLVQMVNALSSVEGLGRMLDPDFEMLAYAEPFVRKVRLHRLDPRRIAEDFVDSGTELLRTMRDIPEEFRNLLQQARAGRLRVSFQHHGLEDLMVTLDRVSNRISYSIVLASLVIGSSLIVLAGIPPKWFGIPVIGIIGYVVAGFMGFWLLISILRRGRM
jgi:ubiquinone biosynthesis protein